MITTAQKKKEGQKNKKEKSGTVGKVVESTQDTETKENNTEKPETKKDNTQSPARALKKNTKKLNNKTKKSPNKKKKKASTN